MKCKDCKALKRISTGSQILLYCSRNGKNTRYEDDCSLIPEQLKNWRFILLQPKMKIPTGEMNGWAKNRDQITLAYDSPKLVEHLINDGNYGVTADIDRFVLAADTKEVEQVIESRLPKTFTVQSPRHKTKHFYFYGKITKSVLFKPTVEGDPCADLKHGNAYVVGSESVFKEYGKYKVIDDVPIATVTEEQLLAAIDNFIQPKKNPTPGGETEKEDFAETPELNFPIEKIIPNINALTQNGNELFGPHPLHGSTTGANFHVDLARNVWFCFRAGHESGGNSLYLLAVMQGIINCEDAHKGVLRGEKFKKTVEKGKELGLIPKDFKLSKMPYEPNKYVDIDEKGHPKVNYEIIVGDLQSQFTFKTPDDIEELYLYKDGVYIVGESKVKGTVESWLGKYATNNVVNEVLGHLIRSSYVEREDFNKFEGLLPVKNGLLDLVHLNLKPFDKNKIFTYKINVDFDITKKSPKWENFLTQVLKTEDIPTLQEWLGYTLLPHMPFHKMMWFFGSGRNGKGTIIRTLEHILGKRNCSHLELSEFSGDRRFSVALLYGKLINVSSEPNVLRELQTPLLKNITGEDSLDAEIKNKQRRLTFTNTAKPFVIGNRFPKVNDVTVAFWDRVLLLSFPNSFIDKEQKPNIEKEWLNDPDEVSGILNWMLFGLHRLLENGVFTQSQTQREVITEFKRASDSIGAWLIERVEFNKDAILPREDSFNDYKNYCDTLLVNNENISKFCARLRNTPKIQDVMHRFKEGQKGKQMRCWKGIHLKPTIINEPLDDEQKTLPNTDTPDTPDTAFYNYPVGNKNVVEKELEKGVPTVPSVPVKFGFEPHLGNDDMYHCPKCPFCCFGKDDFEAHVERHRSDPNGVNEEGS